MPNLRIVQFSVVASLLLAARAVHAQLVINEVEYDESGVDTGEYIELENTGSSALDVSSYTLVFVNGGGAAASVYRTLALGPGMIAPGGYFVVCANAANTPHCDQDVSPDSNLIENGPNDALVLRQGATDVDRLSYEGTLTGFAEGTGAGADTGASAAEGLARCPDGADSGDNGHDYQLRPNTPAAANSCDDAPPATPIGACGDPAQHVGTLQGSGATSPLLGASAVIEAVVVGDFQAGSLNGFYVQDPDANQDGDPETSDGLFVFQGSVQVELASGQLVRVAGKVAEFDGMTELSDVSAIVVCPGAPVASARALTFPLAASDALERYEGMLVQISQRLTVTGNYDWGRYGSLDLSAAGRLLQPTAAVAPGAPALALQTQNDRNRIVLDDADGTQNPNPLPYQDANHTRRVGDSVPGLIGILDQRFGAYRLQPTAAVVFEASNPRPPPPNVPGRLHVASANLLNYFTTLDDGAPHCGPDGTLACRGANTAAEFARQRAKLINELGAIDADVLGLLEVENNASAAVSDIVAGLNTALGADTYAAIDTGTIGSDAIKVALLYKPATVSAVGAHALLDSHVDPKFLDTKNRPVLAQTFSELSSGARFTVALNHWKSKGSDCNDVSDPDLGDGQGNCNVTRRQAAEAVIAWLATDPTASGDAAQLLIGDFNAYAREDPIQTLVSAGYEALAATFVGAAAYSFQFDGQSGYLDHAFTSPALSERVTGFAEWHNNADEPAVLDYNTEFKTEDPFNASDPYRASDHDPLIVGLELSQASLAVCRRPSPPLAAGLLEREPTPWGRRFFFDR